MPKQQIPAKQQGLWRTRIVIILLCAVIGAGAGFASTLRSWTKPRIESRLAIPRAMELGNYFALFGTYQLVSGAEQENNDSGTQLQAEIFAEFNRTLQSGLLAEFLIQQNTVKDWAKFQNQTADQTASEFAQMFTFSTQNGETLVSVESPFANTDLTVRLLTDFIDFADIKTKEELYADLIYKWKVLFQQIKGAVENLNDSAAKQDWENKLKLMQSVQPLDDKLVPYRYVKVPAQVQQASADISAAVIIGAIIGFAVGLPMSLATVRRM